MIACEHRFHRSGRPLGLSPAVIQEGRASGGGAERTSASIGAGDGAADAADGRSGLTGASTAEEVLSAKEVRGVRSAKAERSAEEEPRPTPAAGALCSTCCNSWPTDLARASKSLRNVQPRLTSQGSPSKKRGPTKIV